MLEIGRDKLDNNLFLIEKGEYIANSQLKYAATPQLSGMNDTNNVVSGYNESIINNGNSNYI